MPLRADARDFRRPCAEEGRPGGLMALLAAPALSGGADSAHGLPANCASSYSKLREDRPKEQRGICVPSLGIEKLPRSDRCRMDSCPPYIRPSPPGMS